MVQAKEHGNKIKWVDTFFKDQSACYDVTTINKEVLFKRITPTKERTYQPKKSTYANTSSTILAEIKELSSRLTNSKYNNF